MQYYFDVRHNGETACDTDPEGAEFPDLQTVRSEAINSIREILAEVLQSGVESREGEMIVKNESDETVLTVPFSMRIRVG